MMKSRRKIISAYVIEDTMMYAHSKAVAARMNTLNAKTSTPSSTRGVSSLEPSGLWPEGEGIENMSWKMVERAKRALGIIESVSST
jgi:hypothetical protein